jgi:2-methylcitrate dehydratase
MAEVDRLAEFAVGADYAQLSEPAREQLKIRVLDTVAVAVAALDAGPTRAIRGLTEQLGGNAAATLIGGGSSAPDRVAFYNTALSRYLDFMDSYLAAGETCHPSDNLGAVLAAAESVGATGRDFLTALAVAYQVQIRLSDVAPVRAKGFDHTVQGAYAVAAGVARALGMAAEQTANAIAISGTANNALRVTRTGDLSNWKGLAYPQVAKEGVHAALLARAGITGPKLVFEGNKGLRESLTGEFAIDWAAEDLEGVTRTIVKKHNAEIHSQTALDAAVEIARRPGFDPTRIRQVRVETFKVAFDIIGGGEEGDKRAIRTKEEADHSLPYLVAVALCDGVVEPAQFAPARIAAPDVQRLLRHIEIRPDDSLTARFPAEMPSRVEVELDDGHRLTAEKTSYRGFRDDPLDWDSAMAKYTRLVTPFTGPALATSIAGAIRHLDERPVSDLTGLLGQVPRKRAPAPSAPAAYREVARQLPTDEERSQHG